MNTSFSPSSSNNRSRTSFIHCFLFKKYKLAFCSCILLVIPNGTTRLKLNLNFEKTIAKPYKIHQSNNSYLTREYYSQYAILAIIQMKYSLLSTIRHLPNNFDKYYFP
uniref:Uncharacterized protein n=1 Tax=Lepeophtheirus salmonis TaxID=72036 RepID=A0A0K2V688_LEPSM